MKEQYKISIETVGDFSKSKRYNTVVMLTPKEFTALVNQTIEFVDALEKTIKK